MAAAISTLRPAGVGQAEQLRHLVEGFADGVVDGRAEAQIIADAPDGDELGVAAGHEQEQIREGKPVGEARGQRVGFEMIDGDEGLAAGQRQRLRHGEPDDDAADEAGTGGGGDAVEVGEPDAGVLQRAHDQPVEHLDMRARGDLRHDAAEGGVLGDLAHHLVREDLAAAAGGKPHDGGGGLVAGGFNAENAHGGLSRLSFC